MNLLTRKEAKAKIAEIKNNKNRIVKTGATLPIRPNQKFNVYQIDLEYLRPNIYNDRITWKIREYEAINEKKLSFDSADDIEYVYSLIEKESPKENKKTLEDLANNGQQLDGVITNEGIIIDGNRRATLLRKLYNGEASKFNQKVEAYRFFNAVVLEEDISDREIMALETLIQIGQDEKVNYNRICLYIKVDNLTKAGYNDRQIADYMNMKPADIKDFRDVFKLMIQYLDTIGKPDQFTLLDKLEDQFISTNRVFRKLDNGTYSTADNWDYKPVDVADFKQVCFDYLRAKFEGKQYRDVLLGKPNKANGVFIKKDVWKEFLKNHENIVESNKPDNEKDWIMLGKNQFSENLVNASNNLKDILKDRDITEIVNTIDKKVRTLNALLKEQEDISSDDVKKLKQINKQIYKLYTEYE